MMIDHQVDAVDQPGEVVRLDVDHRDAVKRLEVRGGDGLGVDVEQVGHPQVLGRATFCRAPMMAVALVRRSRLRSASPLAMASGSGSLCSRISTRSASAKYRGTAAHGRA